MVVDALRADFLFGSDSKMTFVRELIQSNKVRYSNEIVLEIVVAIHTVVIERLH
jgi:hypothetical protein